MKNSIKLDSKGSKSKNQMEVTGFIFDDRNQQKQRALRNKEMKQFNVQEGNFKGELKQIKQTDNSDKLSPFDGYEHNVTPKLSNKQDYRNQLDM